MSEITYLESIIIPLTQDECDIVKQVDEQGILLNISASKKDMGRIIGKRGETAKALRRIMRQFGITRGMHISVKIIERI